MCMFVTALIFRLTITPVKIRVPGITLALKVESKTLDFTGPKAHKGLGFIHSQQAHFTQTHGHKDSRASAT